MLFQHKHFIGKTTCYSSQFHCICSMSIPRCLLPDQSTFSEQFVLIASNRWSIMSLLTYFAPKSSTVSANCMRRFTCSHIPGVFFFSNNSQMGLGVLLDICLQGIQLVLIHTVLHWFHDINIRLHWHIGRYYIPFGLLMGYHWHRYAYIWVHWVLNLYTCFLCWHKQSEFQGLILYCW